MDTRINTSLQVCNKYYPIEIDVNFSERSINVECMDMNETLRKDTDWEEQQMDNEEFVLDWILERLGDKIVNNIKTHYID